jgi:hypothetical protein
MRKEPSDLEKADYVALEDHSELMQITHRDIICHIFCNSVMISLSVYLLVQISYADIFHFNLLDAVAQAALILFIVVLGCILGYTLLFLILDIYQITFRGTIDPETARDCLDLKKNFVAVTIYTVLIASVIISSIYATAANSLNPSVCETVAECYRIGGDSSVVALFSTATLFLFIFHRENVNEKT